jgi:hypothetical protein
MLPIALSTLDLVQLLFASYKDMAFLKRGGR